MTEERKSVIEEVRANQGLLQEIIIDILTIKEEIEKIASSIEKCQCEKEIKEIKELILDIPQGSKRLEKSKKFHNFQPPPNLPWVMDKESKEIIKK